jgi:hypothetical protein
MTSDIESARSVVRAWIHQLSRSGAYALQAQDIGALILLVARVIGVTEAAVRDSCAELVQGLHGPSCICTHHAATAIRAIGKDART